MVGFGSRARRVGASRKRQRPPPLLCRGRGRGSENRCSRLVTPRRTFWAPPGPVAKDRAGWLRVTSYRSQIPGGSPGAGAAAGAPSWSTTGAAISRVIGWPRFAVPLTCAGRPWRRLQVGSDGALLGCDGRRVVGDHP